MPQTPSQVCKQEKEDKLAFRNSIRNKPKYADRPNSRRKTYAAKGIKSRMGISRWLYQAFIDNECYDRHSKLTDETLRQYLADEFPFTDEYDSRYAGYWDNYTSINCLRGRYNRGEYSNPRWTRPPHISFRYNERGDFLEPRHAQRILTKDEVCKIIDRWDKYWERKDREAAEKEEAIRATFKDLAIGGR